MPRTGPVADRDAGAAPLSELFGGVGTLPLGAEVVAARVFGERAFGLFGVSVPDGDARSLLEAELVEAGRLRRPSKP